MDVQSVERWFDSYLTAFIALGRGDAQDTHGLIACYRLPLLISTDTACRTLGDEAEVRAFTQQQMDDLRSAGYDRSQVLSAETALLNDTCATHRALLSRVRADGTEIARLEATYLITGGAGGHTIAAIVVHSA